MKTIMAWIVARPFTATALLLAVILVTGAGLPRLTIDPTVDGMIIQDEDKAYYDEISDTFCSDQVVIIYLRTEDVFTPTVLQSIRSLTDGMLDLTLEYQGETLYPITTARALTTVTRLEGEKIEGEDDYWLNTNPLLDWIPEDPEELAQLRAVALDSPLYVGDIISADGKVAAVNGFVAEAPKGMVGYDNHLVAALEELVARESAVLDQAGVKHEMFVVGLPALKKAMGDYIIKDMTSLVPVALLLIFMVLAVAFRTPAAMVIPVITGTLSVISAVGLMSWMGYEINLITNMVPLLLLVIGCTEDIHLLSDFGAELREGHSKQEALRGMAIKGGLAVFLTSLTTVLGFLSLGTSTITMLRDFGVAASLGLVLNFLITIVVVPTFLRVAPIPKALLKEKTQKSPWTERILNGLIHLMRHHRTRIQIVSAIVLALFAWGASTVKVNADLMSMFLPSSPERIDMDILAESLAGGQSFSIVVDTGRENGIKDPKVLRAMLALQTQMEEGPFDKVVSVADYIRKTHREMHGDAPAYNVIPDDGVAEYLLLLEGEDMDRLLESTYERAVIAVRHEIHGSYDLKREVAKVEQAARELFPKYVDVHVTGRGILFNKASEEMARGQVESLSLALLFIFFVIAALFVSVKAGMLAMIPNIVPILGNFGLMGWMGIPLSPATCTVSVIALGIAVDDTIHLMAGYHMNLKQTADQEDAMEMTLREQFVPVLSSSVALGLGFSILMGSSIAINRDFGFLSASAMAVALLSDLLVTPAVLLSTQLVSSWDLFSIKVNREVLERSPLFKGFSESELKRVAVLGVMETFPKDAYLLRKGERSNEMYLLLEGQAEVKLGKTGNAKLEPGSLFGEMAFISGEARSADVVALDEVHVLKIDNSILSRVERRYPRIGCKLFINIAAVLTQKVVESNQRGAELMERLER